MRVLFGLAHMILERTQFHQEQDSIREQAEIEKEDFAHAPTVDPFRKAQAPQNAFMSMAQVSTAAHKHARGACRE